MQFFAFNLKEFHFPSEVVCRDANGKATPYFDSKDEKIYVLKISCGVV